MKKTSNRFSASAYLSIQDKALLLFTTLVINLFALAVPLVTLQVYDRILIYQNIGTLQVLTAGIVAIVVLDGILKTCRSTLMGWAAARFEHATFSKTLRHLMNSPLAALNKFSQGEQLQRLSSISKLKSFYGGQSLTSMIDLPFVVVFLGLITYLGGWLVAIPISLLTVFALYASILGKRMQKALLLKDKDSDRRTNFISEILHNIHTVKMLGLEAAFGRRYEALQGQSIQSSYRLNRQNAHGFNAASLFTQIMMVSMVSIGSLYVLNGQISMGVLVACVLLSGRVMQPVQRALSFWVGYQDYQLTKQKLAELYELPTQRSVEKLTKAKGKVAINISPDMQLKLASGKIIALIGAPSLEKTNFLKQIAGILLTKGSITIDGLETSQIPKNVVAEYVGYLSPEAEIFQGTIMENITSFRADKEAQAKEIASYLGIDKVVAKLAHGYETQLLDGPADPITPGVKQRIHIVRVLVNRPRVLLFDYADKSLDKQGYNHLFRLLGQIKGQATMILCSNDHNILHLASEEYRLENAALHLNDQQFQKSGNLVQPLKELCA